MPGRMKDLDSEKPPCVGEEKAAMLLQQVGAGQVHLPLTGGGEG